MKKVKSVLLFIACLLFGEILLSFGVNIYIAGCLAVIPLVIGILKECKDEQNQLDSNPENNNTNCQEDEKHS